jgi:beta-glucanase (GH16 family)
MNTDSGHRTPSGRYWLAGGVMVAGLGAAVVSGAATAAAETGDSGSPSASASASASGPASESATAGPSTGQTAAAARKESREAARAERAAARAERAAARAERAADRVSGADDATPPSAGAPATSPSTAQTDRPRLHLLDVRAADGVTTVRPNKTARTAGVTALADAAAAAQVSTRRTAATTAATTTTTAAAAATADPDPVLVAAATNKTVTLGSMIVDRLYSWGIRSSKMGTDWLDIPVSQATATRWLVKRADIYKNVVIPTPGGPTTPTDPGTGPTTPAPGKLLWETDFSSMSEMLKYWSSQTGRWGQPAGENQYYTDGNNLSFDGQGDLVITARRENTPDRLGAPNNYTSARISTMGKQSISVNTRVVARIEMPGDQGALPAFWSVGLEPGHEYDWPRQGEIDISELPGMGTPWSKRFATGNIHGPAKANNTTDIKLQNVGADMGVDLTQGFHEYGMNWYSDHITWDVDGVQIGSVTKAQYEAMGGDWTPFSGKWPHYLILNVAVGNPWTGDPDPSKPFEAQMKVDWVKAYQL